MSSSRDHAVPAIPRPFRWHPGDGLHPGCLQRMRAKLRRPAKPMGEAWFMGEDRHMFVSLLGDLERCSSEELRAPLEEIASGIASFGPMDEWTDWYRYLLAQLVARHPEQSFDSLYQRLGRPSSPCIRAASTNRIPASPTMRGRPWAAA